MPYYDVLSMDTPKIKYNYKNNKFTNNKNNQHQQQQPQNEKFTTVKLNLTFAGSSEPLNKRENRFWKPLKEDIETIFVDRYDRRIPDLSAIFLQSFTILKYENDFDIPIVIRFAGLPESNHPNVSHEIILSPSTKSNDLNINLLIGLKKKQDKDEILLDTTEQQQQQLICPIPLPIITLDNELDSVTIFPNNLILKDDVNNKPKTICGCERIDQYNYTCMHMKDDLSRKFHLFNPFHFMVTCQRLDGKPFLKAKNDNFIKIEIEMKYYFIHYFDIKK